MEIVLWVQPPTIAVDMSAKSCLSLPICTTCCGVHALDHNAIEQAKGHRWAVLLCRCNLLVRGKFESRNAWHSCSTVCYVPEGNRSMYCTCMWIHGYWIRASSHTTLQYETEFQSCSLLDSMLSNSQTKHPSHRAVWCRLIQLRRVQIRLQGADCTSKS